MKRVVLKVVLVSLFLTNINADILVESMNKFYKEYTEKTKCLDSEKQMNNYSYCTVYNKVEDDLRFTVYKLNRKTVFNYIYCDEKDKQQNFKGCFIEEIQKVDPYDFFKKHTIGLKQEDNYIFELAYEPNK